MIVVLGGNGLLGNALSSLLSKSGVKFVKTLRNKSTICPNKNIEVVKDLLDFSELEKLIKKLNPNMVINCISLSKKQRVQQNKKMFYETYAVLPRVLDMLSIQYNFKYIHISTDGVFRGAKGLYKENSLKDANDIYGRAKILGEPSSKNSVCIRTSIYGHSISGKDGLLDWFLNQDECHGYSNYYFSGISTLKLSEIIFKYFIMQKNFGLYHIGGERISKYSLLDKIMKIYNHKCNLYDNSNTYIDLSLNQDKFESLTNQKNFSHDTMLNDLYVQYTNYE